MHTSGLTDRYTYHRDNYEELVAYIPVALVSLSLPAGGLGALIYHFILRHGKQTTFDPPDSRIGFQASPGGRGTMDIVFSCAATMLVCIVTVVHLDVPPQPPPRGAGKLERLLYYFTRYGYKYVLWSAGLIAPEILVALALLQLGLSHRDVTFMRSVGCSQWTHKHAFFARMGGVRLLGGDRDFVRSGEELYGLDTTEDKSAMRHLDYDALLDDINDKSKADTLGKLLAVFQVTRFLMGTIARRTQHLPISPLEFITCAHVVCALMMYAVWFHKPYGVQRALCVELGRTYVAANTEFDASGERPSARGLSKIREFLHKKFADSYCYQGDPIHAQRFYLDKALLGELYRDWGVVSHRIYQRPGEVVFIPAGCAHQVCRRFLFLSVFHLVSVRKIS